MSLPFSFLQAFYYYALSTVWNPILFKILYCDIQNNYTLKILKYLCKKKLSLFDSFRKLLSIPWFSLQQSLIVQNRKVNLSRYMYFIWSIFKIHTKIYDIITFKAYKPKTGFTLVTSSIINEVITLVAMCR